MKYKRIQVQRLCVLILIVPLFFIAQLAIADTEISGNITEDTTWTNVIWDVLYFFTFNIL